MRRGAVRMLRHDVAGGYQVAARCRRGKNARLSVHEFLGLADCASIDAIIWVSVAFPSAMSRNSRSSVRASTGCKALGKSMLLPLPCTTFSDMSLANHLALAACRRGQGNAHLMNELVRATYVSYFLAKAGGGGLTTELYLRAEAALEQALHRADSNDVWSLNADASDSVSQIIAAYYQQLSSSPTWKVIEAFDVFERFTASNRQSPIVEG